jgi:hypothetical protein
MPATMLYPLVWNWVASTRVKGLASPWPYDPLWAIEDLWIEEEEAGSEG